MVQIVRTHVIYPVEFWQTDCERIFQGFLLINELLCLIDVVFSLQLVRTDEGDREIESAEDLHTKKIKRF